MYIKIESAENSKIKLVKKLSNKKNRDEENKIVIEGINLVKEAVERGISIDFILISENYAMDDFVGRCVENNSVLVYQVSEIILNKIVDAENGVGIIAVIAKPTFSINELHEIVDDGNVLVLDRIQDPGNMGTMIRTAVAAGYKMVIATKGTVDAFSPKVLRATAGMIFEIPVVYIENIDNIIGILRKANKKIVVTVVEGGEVYFNQDLKHEIALVIGNEGNGVSEEIKKLADIKVTIPMQGEIESLNAAVSAAILMFETIRK